MRPCTPTCVVDDRGVTHRRTEVHRSAAGDRETAHLGHRRAHRRLAHHDLRPGPNWGSVTSRTNPGLRVGRQPIATTTSEMVPTASRCVERRLIIRPPTQSDNATSASCRHHRSSLSDPPPARDTDVANRPRTPAPRRSRSWPTPHRGHASGGSRGAPRCAWLLKLARVWLWQRWYRCDVRKLRSVVLAAMVVSSCGCIPVWGLPAPAPAPDQVTATVRALANAPDDFMLDLRLDSRGRLWYLDSPATAGAPSALVSVYDPRSATVRSATVPDGVLNGLSLGRDGTVWVAADEPWGLFRVDPSTFQVTDVTSHLPAGAQPAMLATSADGALWFSDRTGAIGRLDPRSLAVQEYPLPRARRSPQQSWSIAGWSTPCSTTARWRGSTSGRGYSI